MQTESFDDAIRRKLETIDPKYKEAEVNRVHNYVNRNRNGHDSENNRLVPVLVLSLLGLLITFLGVNSYQQYQENKALTAQVGKLRHTLETAQSRQTKTDTVYITLNAGGGASATDRQYTPQASTGEELYTGARTPSFMNRRRTEGHSSVKAAGALAQDRNANNDQPAETEPFPAKRPAGKAWPEKAMANHPRTKTTSVDQSATQETITSPVTKTSRDMANTGSAGGAGQRPGIGEQQAPVIAENNSPAAPPAPDKEQPRNTNPSNNSPAITQAATAPAKQTAITSTSKRDSGSLIIKKQNDSATQLADKPKYERYQKDKPKGKDPLAEQKTDWSTGLGSDLSPFRRGINLLARMTLAGGFGFKTGISLSKTGKENFRDGDDFHDKRGRNMRARPEINPDTSFKNIEMRSTLVQIPINLTYHLALKNDFTMVFDLGTNLDLFAKSKFSYEQRLRPNQRLEKHDMDFRRPPIPLNNALVAVGLQKRWNNFSLLASPFLNMQFRPVDYRTAPLTLGLRIQAFYHL